MITNNMKQIGNVLLFLPLILMGCSNRMTEYVINGSLSQPISDGTMAYIVRLDEGADFCPIDSCEVVHGKFHMDGNVDSIMMVRLYMGDDNFPIVLESGELAIDIENNQVKISGTPLNDKLYTFLTERDSLKMLYDELPHKESMMYLDGYSSEEILQELGEEELRLQNALDKIDTRFVMDNFDNALGITWFMRLCYEAEEFYGFPTTTPQIDEIYSMAPDEFRQNHYVKEYFQRVNGQ